MNNDQIRLVKRAIIMGTSFRSDQIVSVHKDGEFQHFEANRDDNLCAKDGCGRLACSKGLLHVSNPTSEMPEGSQVVVAVCHGHEYTWHSIWGSWGCAQDKVISVELDQI